MEAEPANYLLQDAPPAKPLVTQPQSEEVEVEAPARPKRRKRVDDLPPLQMRETPLWLRHLHWALALAMLPLAVTLLSGSREHMTIADRLNETVEELSEAEQEAFERRVEEIEERGGSIDKLFEALPNGRIKGAYLPRSSKAHWGFAVVTVVVYFAFILLLSSDGSASPFKVLMAGLFTATMGVAFLLLVQTLADWTNGRMLIGRSVIALLFLILKFIAFSYQAALDPENGFLLSFVGYTLGVGLCEELVKAIPLLVHEREGEQANWRSFFLWGLASGVGFGVAEGLLYSARQYNGITTGQIYLVRFASCVALHAVWAGAVGVTIYQSLDLFENLDTWYEFFLPLLQVIWIPMVMHGLYDTMLKREMNAGAFVVALVSFGYLAWVISRLRSEDDEEARREMLREYKRRRKARAEGV